MVTAHAVYYQLGQAGHDRRPGTLLGKCGVNIATFHLYRDREGGNGDYSFSRGQCGAGNILSQIEAMNGVRQAQALRF